MKRIITNILIVLQVLFFTSCLTTRQTNLLQEPGRGIPSYPMVAAPEEYRVKIGDQLTIIVTPNPMDTRTAQLFSSFASLSGADGRPGIPVHPDGTIHFPYLGNIYVRGKTTLEIQQLMERRMNESVSEGCIVNVQLENRYYSVIGLSSAGRYEILKEKLTILQALAQSGDIQSYGDRRNVTIIRQVDNGTVIKSFDVRSRDIINSEFYYIQPNDIIYVEPLGRRFWGVDSFFSAVALASTAISIGFMIYNFIIRR